MPRTYISRYQDRMAARVERSMRRSTRDPSHGFPAHFRSSASRSSDRSVRPTLASLSCVASAEIMLSWRSPAAPG